MHELDTQKLKLNPPKVNKKMLQATLTQYNLDLLPAQHPQINIIKKLEKLPLEESIKESRALFAKEIGITEELIKIEKKITIQLSFSYTYVNEINKLFSGQVEISKDFGTFVTYTYSILEALAELLVRITKILVIDNGHIIEQGSHDELLKLNGKYAYLFKLQANKYT